MFARADEVAPEVMEKVAEEVAAEVEPILGTLDLVILAVIAALLFYWFVVKRSRDAAHVKEISSLNNLKMASPALQTQSSMTAGFIAKMQHSGRNVVVFYGSQTGTAEEFAGRISKDCIRYGWKGMAADLEECDMEDLPKLAEIDNSLAVFCLATYGEGDPTDNAQEFYDWMQEGGGDLSGVKYVVFSLGNKTYEHYNAMGKYTDQRLEDLGGERVCELGMGDDDGNIEEDFVTWREQFWTSICEQYGVQPLGDEVSIRQYNLTTHEPEDIPEEKVFTGEIARIRSYKNQRPPYDTKNPFLAPVKVNRELHQGGDRSCMHIELDITGSKIRYEAGDHVAVYPVNDAAMVQKIGDLLEVDLDQLFTLDNVDDDSSKKHPFPCPTTYRTALSYYVDFTHPPHTHVLKELEEYASDSADAAFLHKISSNTPEGKSLYREWVVEGCRTMLAILEDLPSVKPRVDHLLELLPRLQARYYSISSSPKVHPNSIHITAVLTDYATPTGRQNHGVATSWLKLKQPAGETLPCVPIFVRKSQFRLPFKTSTPVLMIGPGTGLAPFRGFIQERHHYKSEGKQVGDTVLYFGCRNRDVDYIYGDELAEYSNAATLTQLHVAFSRDQPHKVYVTHLLEQQAESVWKLLDEQKGHIYICGDARNMARDVNNILTKICQEYGGLTTEQAADYIKKLETKGRYGKDVWS